MQIHDPGRTFIISCALFSLFLFFPLKGIAHEYLKYHDHIASPDQSATIDALIRLDLQLPSRISISSDNKLAFVADAYAPPAVSVIDINQMRQVDVIKIGGDGAISSIASSINGTKIYTAISSNNEGRLVELSVNDREKTNSFHLDSAPVDLAVDHHDNFIIAVTNRWIYKISNKSFEASETLNSGREPVRIRNAKYSNRFFITNARSRSVTVLTLGENATDVRDLAVPFPPWDVRDIYPDGCEGGDDCKGKLFVSQLNGDILTVFSLPGMKQGSSLFTGNAPTMLESSPSGEILYVLRTCPSVIVSVDPKGPGIVKAFNLSIPSPRDMAVTKDDKYLLVTADNGNLYVLDTDQFKPDDTTALTETTVPGPQYSFRILFDFDKAIIKPEFKSMLMELASRLKSTLEKVEIDGYTCNLGTDPYNDKLSLRRAEAVKGYLIYKGVTEEQIIIKGLGERYPFAPNINEKKRKLNRRVEIEILNGTEAQ